jgi:hypothetical protein
VARIIRLPSSINPNVNKFFRNLVKDVMTKREKTGETRKDFMQLLIEIKEKGGLSDEQEHKENKQENSISTNVIST